MQGDNVVPISELLVLSNSHEWVCWWNDGQVLMERKLMYLKIWNALHLIEWNSKNNPDWNGMDRKNSIPTKI